MSKRKAESEPEFFHDQREFEDLWKQCFPVGTEWDNMDLIYEYNWNFSNLEGAFEEGGVLHGKKVYIFCVTEPQYLSYNGEQKVTLIPVLVAPPVQGASASHLIGAAMKPSLKSTPGLPKSPQGGGGVSGSYVTGPSTPTREPVDASKTFSLQFGSISRGMMNGMQVPARTSSAPPNFDEQKQAQSSMHYKPWISFLWTMQSSSYLSMLF